ncbi:MAG TPA: RNA methyltransferase [Jatrophihabitans sp.]|nr:RNA methyltransferase [Jatrophihabitans sp.]
MLSSSNARLVAARRLTRRRARRETGRFLVEGAQAVREALRADVVEELFATDEALLRHGDLLDGADVSEISAKDAASLSETVTPQGLVAVCSRVDVELDRALGRRPRLVAVLVEPNDPGNLGTIIRTADAAGAELVVVVGGVDAYNGKAVRSSAGSLFHLDLVLADHLDDVLAALAAAGIMSLATTGAGARELDDLVDDGTLRAATAWLFGTEAHGLPPLVISGATHSVRVPIYGRAESLNLAAAAAVCLYASARAHR